MCTGATLRAVTCPACHAGGRYDTSIQSHHVSRRDSRISSAISISVTPAQNRAGPLFLFLPPLFHSPFFSLHLAVAPLAIWSSLPKSEPMVPQIYCMSWYSNRVGYVRHLYCLIFLYFEIFAWMNYVVGIRDETNVFGISM
jgi:hypothetical protein